MSKKINWELVFKLAYEEEMINRSVEQFLEDLDDEWYDNVEESEEDDG